MKSFRLIAALTIVLVVSAYAAGNHHGDHDHPHAGAHDSDPGWFDPAHCDICKPMHERPDVMMAMKWDTHKIANGMLMTTSVPKEKKADFYAVCEKMHSSTPSHDAKLCGFCKGFGGAIAAGATVEEVKTDFGMITIVTATDPATVEKIHVVADRSIEEMAKMAAAE